jgi:hypothetical protein
MTKMYYGTSIQYIQVLFFEYMAWKKPRKLSYSWISIDVRQPVSVQSCVWKMAKLLLLSASEILRFCFFNPWIFQYSWIAMQKSQCQLAWQNLNILSSFKCLNLNLENKFVSHYKAVSCIIWWCWGGGGGVKMIKMRPPKPKSLKHMNHDKNGKCHSKDIINYVRMKKHIDRMKKHIDRK